MLKFASCLLLTNFLLCVESLEEEILPGPIVPQQEFLSQSEGTIRPPLLSGVTQPQAFKWIIQLPTDDVIFVEIVQFDVPRSESCRLAYLDIFDGPNTRRKRLPATKLCGKLDKTGFVASTNAATVVYYTSENNRGQRFTIKYGSKNAILNNRCGFQFAVQPIFVKKESSRVGILNSAEGSWPWIVILSRDSHHFCHGVIVTPRHVITASQCLNNHGARSVEVSAGKHVTYHRESGEQAVAVKGIHPVNLDDDDTDEDFDVTIVYLERNITFTPYVKAACLPPELFNIEPSSICVAVGWGFAVNKKNSKQLQELVLKLESDEICEKRLKLAKISSKLSSFTHVTATPMFPGDSKLTVDQIMEGSPLLCFSNQRWLAVGILKQTLQVKEGNKNKVVFIYKKVKDHLKNIEEITGIDVPMRSYTETD